MNTTIIQCVGTIVSAGVIGWATNWVAIKMLFRPHKAYYVFGKQLPFTPGLIVKERVRIATSLGKSISDNLMNQEVLTSTLLSEEMLDKIRMAIDGYVSELRDSNRSIREYLARFLTEEEMLQAERKAQAEVANLVYDNLVSAKLGDKIAHIAVEHAIEKMSDGISGFLGAGKLAKLIQEPAEKLLSKNIDEMLEKNGLVFSAEMVGDGITNLLSCPLSKLMEGKETDIESVKTAIIRVYTTLIQEKLPQILGALDLPTIIEKRINEMDMDQLEYLIFEVMNKELQSIIWFGAALGVVVGVINCLFLFL